MVRLVRAFLCFLGITLSGLICANEVTTYTYNGLGRLSRVQISGGPSNGTQIDYNYDSAGNRVSYIVSGSSTGGSISISPVRTVATQTTFGVVLSVRVAGDTPPTGMVTFSENGVFLGVAEVYDGEASIILEGFPLGAHTITASYSGDSVNAPYSHTFTIKVMSLSWLPAVLEIVLSD